MREWDIPVAVWVLLALLSCYLNREKWAKEGIPSEEKFVLFIIALTAAIQVYGHFQ